MNNQNTCHAHAGNRNLQNGDSRMPPPPPAATPSSSASLTSFPSMLFANSSEEWNTVEQTALKGRLDRLKQVSSGGAAAAASEPLLCQPPLELPPRYVLHPMDGTVVLDPRGQPLTAARVLATKPLQSELLTRPGPGNKRLTYMSGEGITRLLNEIFGFDGWCLDVRQIDRAFTSPGPDSSGRFQVVYTALVRLTVLQRATCTDKAGAGSFQAAAYREDIGVGDSYDKQLQTAIQHAVKGAVTDGVKRAARHFGDRLGNSLYEGNFSTKSAPVNLSHALAELDQKLTARYDWDLHARQLKKKQAPSYTTSSATTTASAPAQAGLASSTSQHQLPRHQLSSVNGPGTAQPHQNQLQSPSVMQYPSSMVGASTMLASLELAQPMASSAPILQPNRTSSSANGTGTSTTASAGASGWHPPVTNPMAAPSMLPTSGNPPPNLVTPGPDGGATATPLPPPERHPGQLRPRPETASGRNSLGLVTATAASRGGAENNTTSQGASIRGDVPFPVASGGTGHPASASSLLPAKRPLERTSENSSRWPAVGAHSAVPPNKPPSSSVQQHQHQPVVKKTNPYHLPSLN